MSEKKLGFKQNKKPLYIPVSYYLAKSSKICGDL